MAKLRLDGDRASDRTQNKPGGDRKNVDDDDFAIAARFFLRAVGGAVAVDVSISPWLLMCTVLLALLIGFGKRRYELAALDNAAGHRRNLSLYNQPMSDQAVGGPPPLARSSHTLSTPSTASRRNIHHRGDLDDPRSFWYGVVGSFHLLYLGGQGGAPETMLLTDRPLHASVATWAVVSAILFYCSGRRRRRKRRRSIGASPCLI